MCLAMVVLWVLGVLCVVVHLIICVVVVMLIVCIVVRDVHCVLHMRQHVDFIVTMLHDAVECVIVCGRVVAVYACGCDVVECLCADCDAVSRVGERVIVYCDEC